MHVDVFTNAFLMEYMTQFQYGLPLDVKVKLKNAEGHQMALYKDEYWIETKYIVFCEALLQNDMKTIQTLYEYYKFKKFTTSRSSYPRKKKKL